jgi:hypothetical protein
MRTPALLLATAALAGCPSTSEQGRPYRPSSTSLLAFVQAGGRSAIFMPAPASPTNPHALLAVVDAASPHGAPGVLGYVDLGVEGFVRAVGGDGGDVVAVDGSTPTVYFVDAASAALRGRATLPPRAQLILSSNAPGNYSMGAAVDAARRRAYVSASYGLLQYDLDSRILTGTFEAPATEIFALDAAAGRLYSAFYLCQEDPNDPGTCFPYQQPGGPDLTDSLTVTDIASGRVYSLVDPSAADPHAPLGFEVDAVALDVDLQVAAVAVEDPPAIHVLDLAAASYDGAALTCRMSGPAIAMPDLAYVEMAADSVTHLLAVAQENGTGLLFLDLAAARQGTTSVLEVTMPRLPDGGDWLNYGDVHAATTGQIDGRPYAFLASDDWAWIARIDLQGVADVMRGVGTFEAQVAYVSVPPPP